MFHHDKQRGMPAWMRRIALFLCLTTTWLVVSPALAQTNSLPQPQGHARTLSPVEMQNITGAQFGTGDPGIGQAKPVSPEAGENYPWEGSYGGTNTGNGNKLTSLPIVGWNTRGTLPMSFTLYHNSQSTYNDELGQKRTHSFDNYLSFESGDVYDYQIVHMGSDMSLAFIENFDGTYTAPVGIHDTLVKTGSGTSAVYTLTTKNQLRYIFTSTGTGSHVGFRCTSIKDRNDNALTISINSSGYVTQVSDPTSRTLTLGYTSGKITSVTDPLSRVWTLSYNTAGDLASVAYPLLSGQTTAYTVQHGYNTNHDITTLTDRRGKVWTYTYDNGDGLLTETDPLSHTTTYAYTSGYATITDANSHVTKHNYTSGRLSSVVDGGSNSESYTYDSSNNKTGVTDKRGKSWGFTYDSRGNVLTKTSPLSKVWTNTYNSKNDVLTSQTPLGYTTTYTYNTAGNLTGISDALSHATTLTVNGYGQVTAASDALSHSSTFGYDANGNQTTATDALSHTTTTAYDTIGRPTSVTDATSRTVSTVYDNLGRTTSITAPGSRTTSFTYDGSGNKLTQTNSIGKTDTFTYDNAGQMLTHTDPLSRVTSFGYDNAGNKTTFTDGRGKVTTYAYTVRDQLSTISYPDSTSDAFTYNANGDLATKTDGRSVTKTLTYDNASRLTGVSYSDSTASVTFGYDNDDRKTSMADASGTTSYTYDNASRVTARNQPAGTVTYGYDDANRLTSRTLAGSSLTTLGYDNANRQTSVVADGETTSLTFDDSGRPLTTTFANGAVETKTYSTTEADLTNIATVKSGTTVTSQTYTYDGLGRKATETPNSGGAVTYGYDDAGQLTSEVKASAYSTSYTYDNAGNRLTKTLGGTTESYTYDDANRLTAAGSKTYTYDSAGNTKTVTSGVVTTTLTWDGDERLKQVTSTAGLSNTFTYNGLGQRSGKVDSAGTFNFTRTSDAIDGNVLSDGAAKYVNGASGLISEVRGGTSKFYHADGLGSTRAITNASGTTADTKTTDAFGLTYASTGSTPSPFGFAGKQGYQSDSDTGLMLLGHRYYDSSTGRFLSRDPIQDGYNWYIYCGNDPVNGVDPEGLNNSGGGAKNKSKGDGYIIIGDIDDRWIVELPFADRERGPHPGGGYILRPRDPKSSLPRLIVYPVPNPTNPSRQDDTKNYLGILPPGVEIPSNSGLDVDAVWSAKDKKWWHGKGDGVSEITPDGGTWTGPRWMTNVWPGPPPAKIKKP